MRIASNDIIFKDFVTISDMACRYLFPNSVDFEYWIDSFLRTHSSINNKLLFLLRGTSDDFYVNVADCVENFRIQLHSVNKWGIFDFTSNNPIVVYTNLVTYTYNNLDYTLSLDFNLKSRNFLLVKSPQKDWDEVMAPVLRYFSPSYEMILNCDKSVVVSIHRDFIESYIRGLPIKLSINENTDFIKQYSELHCKIYKLFENSKFLKASMFSKFDVTVSNNNLASLSFGDPLRITKEFGFEPFSITRLTPHNLGIGYLYLDIDDSLCGLYLYYNFATNCFTLELQSASTSEGALLYNLKNYFPDGFFDDCDKLVVKEGDFDTVNSWLNKFI